MKTYVVTGRMIEIHGGVLVLNKDQARRRANNLKRTSKTGSQFEVLRPVQFKQGEDFGYDGDLPKALHHLVVDKAEIEAEAKAEEKAKAKADAKIEAEAKTKEKAKAKEDAKAKEKAEAKVKAFSDAVGTLEKGNTGHWTKDDEKPECKALEAAGLKVTAEERDALWADHQQGAGE